MSYLSRMNQGAGTRTVPAAARRTRAGGSRMQAGELISAAEAAELLGRSKRTIARMAGDGRLTPALKLPGLRGDYLFQRSYVERLAAAQARQQNREAS